jgi:hypothetical protein
MLETGEPEHTGEIRYQAGAIATAVPSPDGLKWAVRNDTDDHVRYTPILAHAGHWSAERAVFRRDVKPPEVPKAPAPLGTQFYPDCSNNNWGSVQDLINFLEQLAGEGFAGMCHKVSEGNYYQDPFWGPCLQWCIENNFPVIGYHYVTTNDPAQQAQTFVANNGGANGMTDWEANGGNVNNLAAVVNALNDAGVEVQLGYSPQWYWNEVGGGSLVGLANALVSSAYPAGGGYASTIYANGGGDTGEGWNAYGGVTPTVWQFTDRANIAGINVDCNAFRGSTDELAALFTGSTPSNPPPVTPPAPVSNPPAVPKPADDLGLDSEEWDQMLLRWDFLGNRTAVEAIGAIGAALKIPGFIDPKGAQS